MGNVNSGKQAELIAAQYLQDRGYSILDQNWKTRYCEIDIVAKKDDVIIFVEVKYRLSSVAGDGFAYITSKKISQMQLGAESWVAKNRWDGEYCLGAMELAGPDYSVTYFLDAL